MSESSASPLSEPALLADPPYEAWRALLEANAAAATTWRFEVAGLQASDMRRLARADARSWALRFSERCGGIDVDRVTETDRPDAPVVMTGHQPDFSHPGIWIKGFCVDRLAREVSGTGLDLVVDSDAFDVLAATGPSLHPNVHKHEVVLASGGRDVCYACAPVPDPDAVEKFCAEVDATLAALDASSPRVNFGRFCGDLRGAANDAHNLAELMTFARRRYEASAGTRYLELPVTSLRESRAFAHFVADIAQSAERFTSVYNLELQAFREVNKVRSAAQPFPDLARRGSRLELPFWLLSGGRRRTLWVEPGPVQSVALFADDEEAGRFEPGDVASLGEALARLCVAPKALTLTLFARVFLSDLFIHGTGGGRYDRVTDGVIRSYYGIEPPRFVVASLTERLPIAGADVGEEEVTAARERVHRFEHNPDSMFERAWPSLGDVAREKALALSREKDELASSISEPGADRKRMGLRIREINTELRAALAPLGEELRQEVERVEAAREAARVLGDRTYPFCYWTPEEIAARLD